MRTDSSEGMNQRPSLVLFMDRECARALEKKLRPRRPAPFSSSICQAIVRVTRQNAVEVEHKTILSKVLKDILNWRMLAFGPLANTASYEGTIKVKGGSCLVDVFLERFGVFKFVYDTAYVFIVTPVDEVGQEEAEFFLRALKSCLPRPPLAALSFDSDEIVHLRRKYSVRDNIWDNFS